MVLKLNWKIVVAAFLLVALLAAILVMVRNPQQGYAFLGGLLTQPKLASCLAETQQQLDSQRYQRPSNQTPIPNPYHFSDFEGQQVGVFDQPEEAIKAYYGILEEASNMEGYTGGCGTIGNAKQPYRYAYQLLSPAQKQELSLLEFVESFSGTGHTTFLKLLPAYRPPGTPDETQYYMVEIETITGRKLEQDTSDTPQISLFGYYYGIVTVENIPGEGWKIGKIYYIPENFLCAPYHSWFYDSTAFVQIVYQDNMKVIEKIDRVEQDGSLIHIYASEGQNQYRFDFVRLTNGYDILLHEYRLEGESWQEIELIDGVWKPSKLSIQTFVSD